MGHETTWGALFAAIAPHLLERPHDLIAKGYVETALRETSHADIELEGADFQALKAQFKALGLIDLSYPVSSSIPGKNLLWALTPKGETTMVHLLAVRRGS